MRVEVEVDSDAVERRVAGAAREVGKDLRLPGFRKGKVPPEIVQQRVGRDALVEQALRNALPEWYEHAVAASGIFTVGDPDISLERFPDEGEPLSFSFEIGVRPVAALGDYKGLEVGRPDPEAPDEAVERELERLREAFATLEPAERPAAEGDHVLVDFTGEENGEVAEGIEGRDQLIELGGGRFPKELEDGLTGAAEGDEREIPVEFPDDYGSDLAGRTIAFRVSLKAVNQKVLPELNDEFATQASEFDTIAELREHIADRLRELAEREIENEFRQAAVDAAAANAKVDVPDELIEARAEETWNSVAHRLAHQGVDAERYLEISGKTREEMIEEARPSAEQSLRREAVLAAVVEAEGLEVSEEELLEALEPAAQQEKVSPKKLLERLRSRKRDGALRADLLMRKAVDVIADVAKPIPVSQAEAREALWTPEKGAAEEGESKETADTGGLWTPGS